MLYYSSGGCVELPLYRTVSLAGLTSAAPRDVNWSGANPPYLWYKSLAFQLWEGKWFAFLICSCMLRWKSRSWKYGGENSNWEETLNAGSPYKRNLSYLGKRAITKILPRGVGADKTLLRSIHNFSHRDSDPPHRESSHLTKKDKEIKICHSNVF